MSHSAEKCKRGTLLDLLTYTLLQNIKETRRGDPLGTFKNFERKSHSAEKNRKGDPLVSAGFVGYVIKAKNERETLWTKFALALGGFWIVSKKWTDQCEDCSLKKKRSLGEKAPTKKHITRPTEGSR